MPTSDERLEGMVDRSMNWFRWFFWFRFHKPRTDGEVIAKAYRVPPPLMGLTKTPEGWR